MEVPLQRVLLVGSALTNPPAVRRFARELLELEVRAVPALVDAIAALEPVPPDVVVTSCEPRIAVADLLRAVSVCTPPPRVVVVPVAGDLDGVVLATRLAAIGSIDAGSEERLVATLERMLANPGVEKTLRRLLGTPGLPSSAPDHDRRRALDYLAALRTLIWNASELCRNGSTADRPRAGCDELREMAALVRELSLMLAREELAAARTGESGRRLPVPSPNAGERGDFDT
jgi:hypothetical protein